MAREMLAECKSVLLEQAHWVVAEEMTILCFLKGFSTETCGLKVHSEQCCPSEGAACESQPLSYKAAAEQELRSGFASLMSYKKYVTEQRSASKWPAIHLLVLFKNQILERKILLDGN